MITGVPCFYSLQISGEAAQYVADLISPAVAFDVAEVEMISEDFEHDMSAVICADNAVCTVSKAMHEVESTESFNPVFLPGQNSQIDAVLEPQENSNGVLFTGLDGNPFTVKLFDVRKSGELIIRAKVQFHPFEFPSYSDIIDAHRHTSIN